MASRRASAGRRRTEHVLRLVDSLQRGRQRSAAERAAVAVQLALAHADRVRPRRYRGSRPNLFPLDGTTAVTVNQAFVKWDEHGARRQDLLDLHGRRRAADHARLQRPERRDLRAAVAGARHRQARPGLALDAAVEEPQADLNAGGGVIGRDVLRAAADLAARVRYESDRGHFSCRACRGASRSASPARPARWSAPSMAPACRSRGRSRCGKTTACSFRRRRGKGVGRYFNDPLSATGLALNADRAVSLLRTSGATLYYQRKWAPDWMTVMARARSG